VLRFRKARRAPGPPDHYTEAERLAYWKRRKAHERRIIRIQEKRFWLIDELGGPHCQGGDECPNKYDPEKYQVTIHHVNGRTWSMERPQEWRINEMIREHRRGVPLGVLCRECNSRIGDPTLSEVPF
jgi:hypothetical protein